MRTAVAVNVGMRSSREVMMQARHPGIRIDSIQVEETGGLIFAVGMSVIFMLAVPSFVPVVGAAIVGGALLAPVLHWMYR